MGFSRVAACDCIADQVTQEFLPILAALPHLSLPVAMADDLLAYMVVERVVVLVAVEQSGTAADDIFLGVPGDAGKRRIDRYELEARVHHGYRFVHAAQYLSGDPTLTFRRPAVADVLGGTGHERGYSPFITPDDPAACADPDGIASVEQYPGFNHQAPGHSIQAGTHGPPGGFDVVDVQELLDLHVALAHDIGQPFRIDLDLQQADAIATDVVFPVVFTRRPQGHLQAVFAVAENPHAAPSGPSQGEQRSREQYQQDDHGTQQSQFGGIDRHAGSPRRCSVAPPPSSVGTVANLQQGRRAARIARLDPPLRLPVSMTAILPSHADIQASSRRLGLGANASELHGGLCGWLAGGGATGPEWLARVLADDGAPAPDGVLEEMRAATAAQIEDPEFRFALVLPAPDASLHERSLALFDWCRGFVGGFGLAAGAQPPVSEEGHEALADIAKLAAASAQEEGDEEDERALQEIHEFVRVAALLLHGDCAMGRRHRQRLN